MNSTSTSSRLWALTLVKIWLFSLVLVVCEATPLYDNAEYEDAPVDEEARYFSLEDYLARLMAARNGLYGPYHEGNYGELMVPDLANDKRSSSRAENNFQLRVRRGQGFSKPMAESNFQLRVRKDLLDRFRQVPQIRSSAAESNFQLRVRKSHPSMAENNFQLRVRKSDERPSAEEEEDFFGENRYRQVPQIRSSAAENNFQLRVRKGFPSSAENNFQLRVRKADPYMLSEEEDGDDNRLQRSVRRTLLEQIRDRRLSGQRSAAEDNFQLRIRRGNSAHDNFQLRVRRSAELAA